MVENETMTGGLNADTQRQGSVPSTTALSSTGATTTAIVGTSVADLSSNLDGDPDRHDILAALWGEREGKIQMGRYQAGEVSARGEAIYSEQVLPQAASMPKGTFVVIDVESGDYETGDDDVAATLQLLHRKPLAVTYAVRVGYRAPYSHTGLRIPGRHA